MACFFPRVAYRRADGTVRPVSGTVIAVETSDHFLAPLRMKCGYCLGCKLERTTGFAVRATHEALYHTHATGPYKGAPNTSFLTLTYNDKHLPEDGVLIKAHFQLFMKRLRKRVGPVRFLASGEYGERNLRPHYHLICFGEDFTEDRKYLKRSKGGPLFRSSLLDDLWKCQGCGEAIGFATIGSVSFQSAAYVARYALKTDYTAMRLPCTVDKVTGEAEPVRPYALMSRNKGLGNQYFHDYVDQIYSHDQVILDGKPFRPPRYYDTLLKDSDPDRWDHVLGRRIDRAEARSEKDPRDESEINYVRNSIAQSKQKFSAHHMDAL